MEIYFSILRSCFLDKANRWIVI